jgi:lipoate---protein ligase
MLSLHVLHLTNCPILRQLQLEEALLRKDDRNWCLINEGTPDAIVLGISGKIEDFIDKDRLAERPVPVVRRFSGGGTVYVDKDTHFVTFLMNSQELQVPCCPKKILAWTASLYQPIFESLDFQIRENDYALGNKKFGGNAQYISKNRWLHHSSLLWDYSIQNMNYLKLPPRMPGYRDRRTHTDFLCRLCDYLPNRQKITCRLKHALQNNFHVITASVEDVEPLLTLPHRKSAQILNS